MNIWALDPEEVDEPDAGDLDEPVDEEVELDDRFGSIEERDAGSELVLTRIEPDGDPDRIEVLRFNRIEKLLRIFPQVTRGAQFHDQFRRVKELQVEAPTWDPDHHSAMSERWGLPQVVGLPKGFATFYRYGVGIKRDYRDLVDVIDKYSSCTIVRFVECGHEGPDADGQSFRVLLQRFADYRATVDRNRSRGRTAVRRVIDAECHNAVADLFHFEHVEPKYGRNHVIRALTEEVSTGYVADAADRAVLVDQVALAAPKVAREAPERFGQLREDIELVSLRVLIDQFAEGLDGPRAGDEGRWQRFFNSNRFALQQVFSMPIVVARQQAHVQSEDVDGGGSRITDFLCANSVTHTALVVEIKTPVTPLMDAREYRGKGTAAVYPPHRNLSGSVSQVQSHMAAVPQDLARRLHSTPALNIDPWNEVRGAVIAGRVSTLTPEQRESFLRYRAGLATVTVLGYDEVLARLKALLTLLEAPPQSDAHSAVPATN